MAVPNFEIARSYEMNNFNDFEWDSSQKIKLRVFSLLSNFLFHFKQIKLNFQMAGLNFEHIRSCDMNKILHGVPAEKINSQNFLFFVE